MGDKYNVKKSDLKTLYATADMMMHNNYHSLYQQLGWKKGRGTKNYHCINAAGHSHGSDDNASMSVDNETGRWNCFGCGMSGNFQSHWRDYTSGPGDSYTDYIIDFLGLESNSSYNMSFTQKTSSKPYKQTIESLNKIYNLLQKKHDKKSEATGVPYIASEASHKMVKEKTTIPIDVIDSAVDGLVDNQDKLQYLMATRHISIDIVKKFKIGWNDKSNSYIFPMINMEGDLVNIKSYNPFAKNSRFKWTYPYSGHEICPTPMNNFTKQKIFFFEGEPDAYCAISFGIDGAVTMGAATSTDVVNVFGENLARQTFSGKEVVICFDADAAGQAGAKKLATSLYPFAEQIKILDLNMGDNNKYGLDPKLTKEIIGGNGKPKDKRVEKDFTDFMKKNEFNDVAIKRFHDVVAKTKVYTENIDRVIKKTYKVTLQESRLPRYYSADGNIELEVMASVADFNPNSFLYGDSVEVACSCMAGAQKLKPSCANCIIPRIKNFSTNKSIIFKLVRDKGRIDSRDNRIIKVSEHDILGLIETSERKKDEQLRKMIGVSTFCKNSSIRELTKRKLLHVSLVKSVDEYEEMRDTDDTRSGDIEVEAYLQGDMDIYTDNAYKFKAVQTTAFNGHHAVLFIYDAEPVVTNAESFVMDQETHDIINIFKLKKKDDVAETVHEHLTRRYDVYSHRTGINQRFDMFFVMDLVFNSAIEIKNPMLPKVTRGWVEAVIAGGSRCGKSIISKFFHNHYRLGRATACSSATTRAGLLGGVGFFKQKARVSWGFIPLNHKGIITMDEVHNLKRDDFGALNDLRSEGIASVNMIAASKVNAKVRKVMLANKRPRKGDDDPFYEYGIDLLKDLCFKNEILSRFDLALVVYQDDVPADKMSAVYEDSLTDFTPLQASKLIMWGDSRKPEDVIYDDITQTVNDGQKILLDIFDSSTQLVNLEMRAKIIRMSVSLAKLLYSTPKKDWNKVLVTKQHVTYIINYLISIYSSKNMKMDVYSKRIRDSEKLGDMRFMMNISKYVDINQLTGSPEFNDRMLGQIFIDYIHKVSESSLYMVDANNDTRKSLGLRSMDAIQKLIGTMVARNCIRRTDRGNYRLSLSFSKWIIKRNEEGDDAERSDILESNEDEQNLRVYTALTSNKKSRKSA